MRIQVPFCFGVTAIAAALFIATDRNRSATAQETAVQNQTDQQLDTPRETSQGETQAPNRTGRLASDQSARSLPKFRASALIGMNVRGISGDDDIGEIKDIAIGQDGKVAYVAVSFGGFLGLGSIAAPPAAPLGRRGVCCVARVIATALQIVPELVHAVFDVDDQVGYLRLGHQLCEGRADGGGDHRA